MIDRSLRIVLALLLLVFLLHPVSGGLVSAMSNHIEPLPPNTQYLPLIFNMAEEIPSESCRVLAQFPVPGSMIAAGSSFQMHWVLLNTGSTSWLPDSTSIHFMTGDRLHTGADIRDLPYRVDTGSEIDILLEMQAPSAGAGGTYSSTWALIEDNTPICHFEMTIQVNENLLFTFLFS